MPAGLAASPGGPPLIRPPLIRPPLIRPPLIRPHTGRVLGGVAAGVAVHLGWPVRRVRLTLVALTFASGAGLLLYVWLWALVPSVDPAGYPGDSRALAAPGRPGGSWSPQPARRASEAPVGGHLADIGIGAVLLLAAASVVGARYGWTPGPGVIIPLLVVIAGAVLAYSQFDEVERSRWAARTGVRTRGAVLRVVAGLVIVLIGVLLVVVQRTDLASAGRALTAAVAVLGGTALVLAPWGVRLWRDLDAERAARIRETERAEIAAHLHDSVLQTLALIQRSSGDAAQVARLARAQERDLRDWLYGPRSPAEATVAGAVRQAGADVEDRQGVAVELVVVGDAAADERSAALVAALREAMLNAVRHAGAPVSVYVEVGPDGVEAFVRDRGQGFDPAAVPPDRLGVRESIIGRMERHGGAAQVRSDAGGTEVRLRLPALAADEPKDRQPEDDAVSARRERQREVQ